MLCLSLLSVVLLRFVSHRTFCFSEMLPSLSDTAFSCCCCHLTTVASGLLRWEKTSRKIFRKRMCGEAKGFPCQPICFQKRLCCLGTESLCTLKNQYFFQTLQTFQAAIRMDFHRKYYRKMPGKNSYTQHVPRDPTPDN